MKPGNLYRYLRKHHEEIKAEVESYYFHGYNHQNLGHCAGCAAHRLFKLTTKQWNGSAGCEYYAAALAYIVHFKLVPNADSVYEPFTKG
jgi:hypothetical protein